MTALGLRAVDISPDNELLRGLEPQEIDLILAAARLRRFSAKSVITYQRESADRLLLLWKGRARYFYDSADGKKLILSWITPGQILGAAALILPVYLLGQHGSSAGQHCARLGWPNHSRPGAAFSSTHDECLPNQYGLSLLVCWRSRCLNFSNCA